MRSVQLFFTTFEELGGSLDRLEQGLFLDAFFALSCSLEDGPLSNAQNVFKALRWYRKLLSLSVLPDLYGPAFSTLAMGPSKEKKESVPLPLAFHVFLERQVLSPDTPVEKSNLLRQNAYMHWSESPLCRRSACALELFMPQFLLVTGIVLPD